MAIEMKYCMQCGEKLTEKMLEGEGMVPWCPSCGDFRFPIFNTAVSMIVMNEARSKIILIKQYGRYGRPDYILVAGYINKGEDAEDAVKREVFEELGLNVKDLHFNHSHYFAPSNTLMLNFTVTVEGKDPTPNREIDSYSWFSPEDAKDNIKRNSLAQRFLNWYLDGGEF